MKVRLEVGETVSVGWKGVGEELFGREQDKDNGEETEDGNTVTGDEVSRGSSTSSSLDDLLPLGNEGELGGVPIWIPSPSDEERLLLAMELAVGFM